MSYSKTTVVRFKGLNSTIAPEIIDPGEARDIMNLRMEKVGKLVSRNGIIFGLFTDPDTSFAGANPIAFHPDDYYEQDKGLIGIGEMILEEKWDAIDTDRLMVYVIRSEPNENFGVSGYSGLESTQRHKEAYLFAPLDGQYKNVLLTDYNPNTVVANHAGTIRVAERCDNLAQDNNQDKNVTDYNSNPESWNINTHQLYAPNRWLPCVEDSEDNADHWIDQFVDMNQYRHRLVISDRINKDMLLEDFFSRRARDEGACSIGDHGLHLRPNCLDPFDIDIVGLDPRFRAEGVDGAEKHEENSYEQGVEHGMALYKYELKKSYTSPSTLPREGRYQDVAGLSETVNKVVDDAMRRVVTDTTTHPFTLLQYQHWMNGVLVGFNPDDVSTPLGPDNYGHFLSLVYSKPQSFLASNADIVEEYPDLTASLRLEEDKYTDNTQSDKKTDGGVVEIEQAANVYSWDDYRLQYYPSSGITEAEIYLWYLRDLDKTFNKLTSTIPRIVKLTPKTGLSKEVPVGVWKYRFAWDYGNNIYSAPSASLLCPDILWSAIQDTYLSQSTSGLNIQRDIDLATYQRPRGLKDSRNGFSSLSALNAEWNFAPAIRPVNGLYSHSLLQNPAFLENGLLTPVGKMFLQLKKKLFNAPYKYGCNLWDANWLQNVQQLSDADYNDYISPFARILLHAQDKVIDVVGQVWEGLGAASPDGFVHKDGVDILADPALKGLLEYNVFTRKYADPHIRYETVVSDEWVKLFKGIKYFGDAGGIKIPLFAIESQPLTYNSIFDSQGRLRTNYPRLSYLDGNTPYDYRHTLIFPSYNEGVGRNHRRAPIQWEELYTTYPQNVLYDFWSDSLDPLTTGPSNIAREWVRLPNTIDYPYSQTRHSFRRTLVPGYLGAIFHRACGGSTADLYYNLVLSNRDTNNREDIDLANKIHTQVYGLADHADTWDSHYLPDIPPDVIDRLVLTGKFELPVMTSQEPYWCDSEYMAYKIEGTYSAPDEVSGQFEYRSKYAHDDWRTKVGHDKILGYPSKLVGVSPGSADYADGKLLDDPLLVANSLAPRGTSITHWPLDYLSLIDAEEGIEEAWGYYEMDGLTTSHEQFPFHALSSQPTGLTNVNYAYSDFNNLEIKIYLDGERFIGLEQLSSYFPSSLLFQAPRMGIQIPNEYIPTNAKRLLVFRTKCSHANDWQPNEYGLIDTVEIRRVTSDEYADNNKQYTDNNGNLIPVRDVVSEMINGTITHPSENDKSFYHGIYYFDRIRDENIDWSKKPSEYEGMRTPIASAFNIALNERMYYLNFRETYQPIAPRRNEYLWLAPNQSLVPWHLMSAFLRIYQLTAAMLADGKKGLPFGDYKYRYVYEDEASILSPYKEVPFIGPLTIGATSIRDYVANADTRLNTGVVVFYLMPHSFDTYIKHVKIYRSSNSGTYYYIGKTDEGDEGIFVDDGLPDGVAMPCTEPDVENYESGLRWSEPFRPDWIKMESFAEYRSGDGKQATGIESLYGNLVIFKETSMHRVAVQAVNPPISRTDEISAEIGCIAPNTLINISNTLYFLSWKGLMSYDNNVLNKVDGPFDEELQYVLTNTDPLDIRDASCAYNPTYNELYLNIPMLPTRYHDSDVETWVNHDPDIQRDYGQGYMYEENQTFNMGAPLSTATHTQFMRMLLGHIYVVNLDKGYATKFAYTASTEEMYSLTGQALAHNWLKKTISPLQLIRKYYTNSYGELRSGDILPNGYGGQRADYTFTDCVIVPREGCSGRVLSATITAQDGRYRMHVVIASSPLPSHEIQQDGVTIYRNYGGININTCNFVKSGNSDLYFDIDIPNGDSVISVFSLLWECVTDILFTGTSEVADNSRCWAGIYIETPYLMQWESKEVSLWDIDDVLDSRAALRGTLNLQYSFPQSLKVPVHSVFKSKFFTGEDESLIKRIRKVVMNVFTRGTLHAFGTTISKEGLQANLHQQTNNPAWADNRIDNEQYQQILGMNTFKYNPSIRFNQCTKLDPATGIAVPWIAIPIVMTNYQGTGSNILSFVPTVPDGGVWTDRELGDGYNYADDFVGKPVRFSLEIDCFFRTQLNEIALHWRPIHSYLS